jgi:hypothetical protein
VLRAEEMTAMPQDRDFKKIVRRRMGKTGESYTAARVQLVGVGAPATQPQTSIHPYGGGGWAFDMFDQSAKRALTVAQAEAHNEGSGLIGPEHVLVGVVRQRTGGAAPVLRELGVRVPAVRAALKSKGIRRVQHPAGRIVPAASTKRLLDQAVYEAKQCGTAEVGTQHLLMGILCETTEPAAQVLSELGATAERVAPLIESRPAPARGRRVTPAGATSPGIYPVATGGLTATLQRARSAAREEGAMFFRSDHLLSSLVSIDSQTPALPELLRTVGADLDELRRRLRPPRQVTELEEQIWRLRHAEDQAINRDDEELARRLLDQEREVRDKLARAMDAWNAGWAKPPSRRRRP